MPSLVITATDAKIDPTREAELVAGFTEIANTDSPDGLIRTQLLRGQDGLWRIQTTWRDLDAIRAVRASGKPPAMQNLLESLGATATHDFFVVETSYES